ncbi:MAG: FAD-binding oxidoreductase, partial [Planctomycetes bacterium]|nr:FAD-binding oxidoreductase [Planctomycetota bacterium]
ADLTCTVGAGVRRDVLDAALAERGVCLACAGEGSIGGLFAGDTIGAMTCGGPSPRSLLLGIEAVLTDGTEFRSGARVVKSVAGFDLHKLFVGSRGLLFAVAALHLKLRPLPRDQVWFERTALDPDAACDLFRSLRRQAVPPAMLTLRREAAGFAVRGRLDGRTVYVKAMLRCHELDEASPYGDLHLQAPPGGEVLAGIINPSGVETLLAQAPPSAPFVMHGGGHFELATSAAHDSDRLLAGMPGLGARACIALAAADRRGIGTHPDEGQRRLVAALRRALDPDGVLV